MTGLRRLKILTKMLNVRASVTTGSCQKAVPILLIWESGPGDRGLRKGIRGKSLAPKFWAEASRELNLSTTPTSLIQLLIVR